MKKLIISLVVAMALMGAVFGAAAAITVAPGNVGGGTSTDVMTGYTVTSTTWTLDSSDPSLISGVAFTISPSTPTQVDVDTNSSTDGFVDWGCSNAAGAVTCTISTNKPTAAEVETLTVVAAN